MEYITANEYVYRVRCMSCGCTGPMAKGLKSAEFLAVLSEWDAGNSHCPACKRLHESVMSKRKTPAAKKKK